MIETITWWAAAEVLGAVTFPITYVLLSRLPDRGYAFSKVVGFLLVGYALWIGATLGLFPNARGSVLLLLIVLAIVSLALVGRRPDIITFVRQHAAYILFVEALYAAAFVTALFLRSYTPDIAATEKPTELTFLNGVLRSDQFPAHDPWFSGHSISYYYFGYVMIDAVTKITNVAPSVAFNLGLGLFAALAVTSGFGLVYNLVLGTGARVGRAVLFGLVGVVLMLLLGNLVGVFEMLSAHGLGAQALYRWADIEGLDGPASTTEWYPTAFWWWWRATRICGGWCIEEFPFFSFLLGDLHAHLMVLPFTLLIMAIGFDLFLRRERIDWRFLLRQPLGFVLIALAIGSLSFLNSWDMPVFLFIIVAIVLMHSYLQEERLSRFTVLGTASFALPLAVLSVLMFIPFYLKFHPIVSFPFIDAVVATASFASVKTNVTTPSHLFLFWAPLLWLTASLSVGAIVLARRPSLSIKEASYAILIGLVPIGLWVLWVVGGRGLGDFGDELTARGSAWLTTFLLVAVLGATAVAAAQLLSRGARDEASRSLTFALLAAFTGVLLILGTEFFYVPEPPVTIRADTVFKLWHKAWILLAISGAFGLHYLTSNWQAKQSAAVLGRSAWAGITVLFLLGAMVYPLAATFARTNGFQGEPTLDGLAFVRRFEPAEYEAVQWLNDNVDGTPVILEAYGDVFSNFGRIASRTGLPTLLSWTDHQLDWRGPQDAFQERPADIARAYTTTSPSEALAILEKYNVTYVYVGPLERKEYGEAGMAKFATFMEVAHQNEEVTIYRLPAEGEIVVGAP